VGVHGCAPPQGLYYLRNIPEVLHPGTPSASDSRFLSEQFVIPVNNKACTPAPCAPRMSVRIKSLIWMPPWVERAAFGARIGSY